MSKLAAAIRNHFIVVPYVEAKASSYRSQRYLLALTVELLLGATPAISVAIIVVTVFFGWNLAALAASPDPTADASSTAGPGAVAIPDMGLLGGSRRIHHRNCRGIKSAEMGFALRIFPNAA